MPQYETILAGVTIDRKGVVHVEKQLEQPLCDLAIDLQSGGRAVDVEHVLAALVMAHRDGKLSYDVDLPDLDEQHKAVLLRYVEILFQQRGGKICED